MDLKTAMWWVIGLIGLLVALQVMETPLKLTLRIVGQSVAGGVALWALNWAGHFVGLHLPLNPVSAVIVGVLGLPGLIVLGTARLFLG